MALPAALDLVGDLRSPSRARNFVTAELSGLVTPDQLDHAVLIVSELVTNAVLHTGTPCTVELLDGGEVLQLRVRDGGTMLPLRRLSPSSTMSTGRGLQLLERVAVRWGVERVPHEGKVVWAELRWS